MAKNPGMKPSAADMANINQAAGTRAANLVKQYSGDINKEKLEDTRRNKAYELALKDLDATPGLNKEFRRIAKETGVPVSQVQEQWMEKRIQKHMERESVAGAGGAGTADASGYVVGQTYVDANGNKAIYTGNSANPFKPVG
jgi:hypothetical protein